MDMARIVDRKGNAFTTVLTDVAFTFGGRTALSNSAEAAARNASRYPTPETKVLQAARQLVAAERTVWEAAVAALNERLAKASGMYGTRQVQPDGSSIWYLHDKPTLGESQAVMKLTGDAIGFSTDGGKSYPFGFAVTGEMVMGVIRSEGISADWVKVGGQGLGAVLEGFVGRDENDQIVSMLNASADQINIKGNRFTLDSDNFKVNADGTVTAKNAKVSGQISSSGTWPDGVHTLNIEDSRIAISIGRKRNLHVAQQAGDGGSIGGSLISVYYGENDNGILLDNNARKTEIAGGYIDVGLDKNGVAKGWITCQHINVGEYINVGRSITAGGGITAGGNITATCGKRRLQLIGGPGGTYEGLYSPDLGKWLVTIDESKNVRLLGKADNATKADYVGHKLTFTGAATGSYDGSAAKTVNIPTVPTALKNPKALTFTGGASGSYDGSSAKTVNIPNALRSLSDGVWKAGNTLTINSMMPLSGIISSSTKSLHVLLPLGKPVASGVTASVTALKGTVRGAQGYIDGSSEINFKSGSTYTVSTALERAVGLLRISITKSSAFTNVTNNTPVNLLTTALTVSFTASSDEPMPGPEIFGDDAGMEGPSMEDGVKSQEKEAAAV